METLILLSSIGLSLYFLFVKGFPWVASKYASYRFKGQVTISSLNLFRLTLRGITLSKSSFRLNAGEVSLSPNFFSHGYSSLLIAKISNVQIETSLSRNSAKEPGEKGFNLQQMVGYVCYMRFLVTFIFSDVSVTLKNPKNMPGHDLNVFVNKGHIYPESTKNGFVSLIAETENAQLTLSPSEVKLSAINFKVNTEIGLFPAIVKSLEVIISSVDCHIPISVAAKWSKNRHDSENLKESADVITSEPSMLMPDLAVFFKAFTLTLFDDLAKNNRGAIIKNAFMDLHLVRSQREETFGCSLDEFLVDFGKTKKPSMSLQKVMFNKTPEQSVVNWADYSLDSNLSEVNQILRICDRLFPKNITVKTVEFQLADTRSLLEESQMRMVLSGGHLEQCHNDQSVRLLVHEVIGRFGHLSCSPNVAKSNYELDNLEVSLDKNDMSITASGCTVYLAAEALSTLCRWTRLLKSRLKPRSKASPNNHATSDDRLRTGFRCDKLTFIFGLENGLALKAETGTTKFKLKGEAKALGCNLLVLSLSEKEDKTIQRTLYIPTITMGLTSSPCHVTLSCTEQVDIFWDPLSHKVFDEITKTVRTILSESGLSEDSSSQEKSKEPSTCQISFKGGIDMRAKLQDHTLHLKSILLEFTRKGSGYWKLDLPSLVCDIPGECEALCSMNRLLIEKVPSHSLSRRHRADIEGCINRENSAIVVSIVTCNFKFPHEVDVHRIVSTEFLGIIKWLKALHGKKETDWNVLPPDILFFAKEVSMEFQDDPFEVNLRDNFELLEDEHYESMKRFKCLENKIEDLKKTHLMIQTAKIEELYSNLTKKNGEIYVHRGKALREKVQKRTRLLSFNLASTEFLIFSDVSMTGKAKILDIIKSMDFESPWPDDLAFTSAFCKWIHFECKSATIQLRDYPQPLADAKHILCWGRIALAEQVPMDRAIRTQKINQGRPYYDDFILERSLMSYKFYHDLAMDMDYSAFAHGPCWEPTISQVSIAMSYVSGRAQERDPSPPLSSWDKLRYMMHGRLLCSVKTFKLLLHTTLDPYNTTEEVELTLSDASFDWTNAQIKCLAELNLFVRTASKYDDCQLLHLPNLTLTIQLTWICMGNPNDHHSVMLCAREKVPEYSHNVEHDSYRAFRSINSNVHLSLETRKSLKNSDRPRLEMFSSTIRWMESLKWLFSGASRPIRKGKVFKNFQPQKQSFFRHVKKLRLSVSLHQLQLDYWTSASLTKGVLMNVAKGLSLSSEYSLKLVKINDGLIHRPRSNWTTEYTNCQMGASDIWFQSWTMIQNQRHIEKSFFFSVEEVQYNRDINCGPKTSTVRTAGTEKSPQHFLTVVGARGAWTQSNRDMAFSLYDSWRRAHILRDQVSSEGLKLVNVQQNVQTEEVIPPTQQKIVAKDTVGQLSLSNLATWNEFISVEKMVPEASDVGCSAVPIVYSEDQSTDIKKNDMEAITACSMDDKIGRNWLIRFINSQMLLKGCETQGHLILSAAKAELLSSSHMPVWKDQALLSKNSWTGVLESMQYFATVIPDSEEVRAEQIMWLRKDQIEERENTAEILRTTAAALSTDSAMPPEIVGSGQSVGGVISEVVGSSDSSLQLQRMVSRCKCEFFYVTYGDDSIEEVADRIPRRPDESPWSSDKEMSHVNAFSLIHHDLDVCTNSLQYSVILDVLNNLLLYTEPAIKSRSENYLRMKYQLMLSNLEDQRKPIIQLQTQIRQMVCQLRAKERAIFAIRQNEGNLDPQQEERLERMELEVQSLKEEVNAKSEELDIRLRCLHEFQMSTNQKHFAHAGENKAELRRKSEIFFSRARWRLTETDGQLGIADAAITNFLYTKNIMRDDSIEHLLEMGFVQVKNLLPAQVYANVIHPSDLPKEVPLDRHTTLRVFCREKAPVGGISVKDHFEINLVPLTIGISHVFFKKIMAFCFPEKLNNNDPGSEELTAPKEKKKKGANKNKKGTGSGAASFYVESPLNKDDVEEMKVRAQQNKLFVYIKIPEVPINVSYKGEKEKNKILDVANFLLQVPTIEYHNVTWTWLDLLMAVKSQIKDSLLSQAIKQKLTMRHHVNVRTGGGGGTGEAQASADDEMKAKLLLGTRPLVPKVPGKKP